MLIGAMMTVIVFLATGWRNSEVNFSEYRTKTETENNLERKEATTLNIKLWNRLIDGQTTRADEVDSSLKDSKEQIQKNKDFIKNSKK